MTGKELQALRKYCLLDVREAAEIIGGVSPRSWQYWEAGRSPVPDDVADKMSGLLTQREYLLREVEQRIVFGEATVSLPYHASHAEFAAENPGQGVLLWRLRQSVAAELYATGLVILE